MAINATPPTTPPIIAPRGEPAGEEEGGAAGNGVMGVKLKAPAEDTDDDANTTAVEDEPERSMRLAGGDNVHLQVVVVCV
jgi:hypothetical protein